MRGKKKKGKIVKPGEETTEKVASAMLAKLQAAGLQVAPEQNVDPSLQKGDNESSMLDQSAWTYYSESTNVDTNADVTQINAVQHPDFNLKAELEDLERKRDEEEEKKDDDTSGKSKPRDRTVDVNDQVDSQNMKDLKVDLKEMKQQRIEQMIASERNKTQESDDKLSQLSQSKDPAQSVANVTVDDIKLDQSMTKNDPDGSSAVDTRVEKGEAQSKKDGEESKKDTDANSVQVTAETKDLLAQASVATQQDVIVTDTIQEDAKLTVQTTTELKQETKETPKGETQEPKQVVQAKEPKIDTAQKAQILVQEPADRNKIEINVPELAKPEKQDVTRPKETTSKEVTSREVILEKGDATQGSTTSAQKQQQKEPEVKMIDTTKPAESETQPKEDVKLDKPTQVVKDKEATKEPQSDNTMLYVGVAALAVAAVGTILFLSQKKK